MPLTRFARALRPAPAVFLVLLAASATAQPAVEAPLDRVLGAVVGTDGLVDYRLLAREHRADLDAALAAVAEQDPSALRTDDQKTAFLLNAYNAHVLALVLQTDAANLEDEDLFERFFETPVRIAGGAATLNQIEHGALRRQDRVDGAAVPRAVQALRPARVDRRVHVGLNCAAVSCPPLGRRAFRASTLDADLGRAWRAFVASPRAARVDGGRVVLSSLFDWFADDFETPRRPLGDLLAGAFASRPDAAPLRRALAGRTAADLRADRDVQFDYDWTVNRR
ncbi:DUF547 domain-containing protein [Rubrivirga sp. S365]|uniref:DUF547 domain-containing protein n=1 Tax=Rubrivirga litoralis TaxID=3075598 RepID=A0ABU3BV38_9BACT|nr:MULTISPECIES: DUF547 domain-containing protein [unclassified Rubrivirga]MDT0633095.1 DUF547 domain-containing protein [Rubrivirga sp. F394]MDT7857863.1 DUF547 domain-containing protein [Rubrivirga sp. S365]